MKRRIAVSLWNALSKMEGMKYDVRFSYILAKNKIALKPEIEILNELKKSSPDYLEFENKRVELAQKYCDRDSSGTLKIINNQFVIKEKQLFEEEIIKLKTEYMKPIENREKQLKEYEVFLNEDIYFTPAKVKFSYLPSQIESSLMEILIEAGIIEDDIDDTSKIVTTP